MFRFQESRKSPELKQDHIDPAVIQKGIETALAVVARLRSRESSEGPLEYHTIHHTETVVRRYREIVAAIRRMSAFPIDEREVQIGELAAAFHDTIRITGEQTVPESETGEFAGMSKVIRPETFGANEKDSGDLLALFMDEINKDAPDTFTEKDKEQGRRHIAVTVPDFDMESGTVFQPNLNETSSVSERALALADIGAAGMGTSEEFLDEGDAVFRENNLDIADTFADFKNKGFIDSEKQRYFRRRMIEWSAGQVRFAQGQKERLDQVLDGLEPAAASGLKNEIFVNFDASIQAAKERADLRHEMSFFELARDMGYAA